ncbi:hypothetical protein GE118_01865 [Mycoplasma sp. NEAQ87857]|uniref:hypothetical protein n=1 Tax=Mycoplasma sp. NEAQ87857 TaxID=2683967 RepID=UPI0013184E60|nr:hypothetical protein [Mycoplasma sp. NEAQ87857]QGZ97542.1 hypothetical protein GE118_01865 [Mycoplasma sp. NEAQ87857]
MAKQNQNIDTSTFRIIFIDSVKKELNRNFWFLILSSKAKQDYRLKLNNLLIELESNKIKNSNLVKNKQTFDKAKVDFLLSGLKWYFIIFGILILVGLSIIILFTRK